MTLAGDSLQCSLDFLLYDQATMSYPLTPKEQPVLDFAKDVPSERVVWQENNVSLLFFSNKNIEALQHGIRYGVYKASNGKHVVGNQDETTLRIIMRSMYLTHAVNLPYATIEQVRDLNRRVLDYAVATVLAAITSHERYAQDISKPVQIMQHAQNVSSKGERSLRMM